MTFGLSAKSYAATDGCPDTWSIDTTKYPNQELIDAKKRLGVNMAETIQIKMIEFKGPLGVMPSDNGLIGYAGINPLAYLYYDSQIQTTIKVEVKDCPNTATFNFVSNWLNKDREKFETTTASGFANQFPERFTDFKKQQIFSESDLCLLYLQDPLRTIKYAFVEKDINFDDILQLENTPTLVKYIDPKTSVEDFDNNNQSNWHLPIEYSNMDIAKYVLDKCNTEAELQRAGEELIKFQERDMFILLKYLKYLVLCANR